MLSPFMVVVAPTHMNETVVVQELGSVASEPGQCCNYAVHIFGDQVLQYQAVTAHSQGKRWKQRKRKRIRAGSVPSLPWQRRLEA